MQQAITTVQPYQTRLSPPPRTVGRRRSLKKTVRRREWVTGRRGAGQRCRSSGFSGKTRGHSRDCSMKSNEE
jgi:hypothetical protein